MCKRICGLCVLVALFSCVLFPTAAPAELHQIGVLETEYENSIADGGGWLYLDASYREWYSDHQCRVLSQRTGEGPEGASWSRAYDTIWTYIPIDNDRHAGYSESTETSSESEHTTTWKSYEERAHQFEPDEGGALICWYCGYAQDSHAFPQVDPPFDLSEVGSVSSDSICAITYDANGGSGAPEPQTKVFGKDVQLSAQIPELEGFYFLGWDTSDRAAAPAYPRDKANVYAGDSDLALYAVWASLHTITYDANGGEGAPEPEIKTPGKDRALSAQVPVWEGYYFLGWSTRENASRPTYPRGEANALDEDRDLKLYAVWERLPKISYEANGGEGAPEPHFKEPGEDATLSEQIPEREGYRFLGWSTRRNASKPVYPSDEVNTYDVDRNLRLYAVWARLYTVTFDANGGEGEPGEQIKEAGTPLTLPESRPVREGYDFVGWSTDAKAVKADYESGGAYTRDRSDTLYAVWIEAKPPKVPLTPETLMQTIVERDMAILTKKNPPIASKFSVRDIVKHDGKKLKAIDSIWFTRSKLREFFGGNRDPGRSKWKKYVSLGYHGYDVQVFESDVLAYNAHAEFLSALGDPAPDAKIVLYMGSHAVLIDAILDGEVYYTDFEEATVAYYRDTPIEVTAKTIQEFVNDYAEQGKKVGCAVVLTEKQ